MALRVSVKSNIDEVVSDLGRRTPAVVKRATSSGLNKGMLASQRAAVKSAALDIGVAQKWIRQRMKRFKATRNRLDTRVIFAPRGLNPHSLGFSAAKALAFYKGQRVSEPFLMRFANGAQNWVVRLPRSNDPSPERTASGARRKGRLPVRAIRIFIGKTTIDDFDAALVKVGIPVFEKEYRRIFIANWAG